MPHSYSLSVWEWCRCLQVPLTKRFDGQSQAQSWDIQNRWVPRFLFSFCFLMPTFPPKLMLRFNKRHPPSAIKLIYVPKSLVLLKWRPNSQWSLSLQKGLQGSVLLHLPSSSSRSTTRASRTCPAASGYSHLTQDSSPVPPLMQAHRLWRG